MALSGLLNVGNTCYVNAVVQCIANCPVLCQALKCDVVAVDAPPGSVASMLNTLIQEMLKRSCTIRPATFCRAVVEDTANGFEISNPEDAQEFFTYLIDRVHGDVGRSGDTHALKYSSHSHHSSHSSHSHVHKIVHGQVCTAIKSCETNCHSTVLDTFSTLTVPIPDRPNTTLYDCLDEYFEEEIMDGDDKYHDDKNGRYVRAVKRHYLCRYPELLVVTLGRFGTRKNTTHVAVPHTLDTQQYLWADDAKRTRYSLNSVVNHLGHTLNHGHYVAECRRGNSWFAFDDDAVSRVPASSVGNASAYMLFYTMDR